jgi:radical SAM superfamily enzyme YgiQ (UPF0313 family)
MKRILLISPDFNPDETRATEQSVSSAMSAITFLPSKAFMVPLGLATVAALIPDDVEVDIWDEAVHGLISDNTHFKKDYDLVGVTGYLNFFGRAKKIAQVFRKRGILVVVGGPGVSIEPDIYRDHFDILFIGEAEYTVPRFIADWKTGSYRSEYRQVAKVDMADSPLPQWTETSANMNHYLLGAVQTTRGCPFDCEFCDVMYLHGRLARHKPVEQVLEEVCRLEQLGVERIFFCDDNFIGNPSYAKILLKELITLNRAFHRPVSFITQISLNVAKDEEKLELLADANFFGLFIGIESPNIESLVEANKSQNYKTDILEDVKLIQSYGLPITAGMIVGFDSDDITIFERQFDFFQRSCVTPSINVLKAPPGSKLWIRLHKEGRVLDVGPELKYSYHHAQVTNIVPARMTRVELLSGYRDLLKLVKDWRNFEARVKGMVSQVRRRPNVNGSTSWKQKGMISQVRRRPNVKGSTSWKQVRSLLVFIIFSMDKEARSTTLRVVFYTLWHAPFMMEKVALMIARQFFDTAQLPLELERIDKQIHLEATQGMKLRLEQTKFFVPEAFEKPYKAIFPELYKRVYQDLADKSHIHGALVEVIYDFLTRWGPDFRRFEEYHRTFLYEICDRTVAKENGGFASDSGQITDAPKEALDSTEREAAMRLNRLADEVLHSVEQELWAFHP